MLQRQDGACMGSRTPDIDEMERSFTTPEVASIIMMHIMMHIFDSKQSYGTLAVGEKDPSARRQPLYVGPPLEGLPDVPEGALIRLDREVYGLASGMSGWRSKNSDRIVAVRLRHERVRAVFVKQVREKGCNRRAWKHHCQGVIRGMCAAGSGRPLDGRIQARTSPQR